MNEKFKFEKSQKITFILLIVVGLLSLTAGILIYKDHPEKIWSNILLNNYYFLAIALCGIFFVAVHKIADSGWQASLIRIPESFASYIPIAAILMFLIYFGMHDIYHWTHTESLDHILQGKTAYLNMPFFFIRMFIYFALWILVSYGLRRLSIKSDFENDNKHFNKSRTYAALFVVLFAITSSTMSWDWLLSIDAHWYSTMFGWYIFSGALVTSIAAITLIILYLRKKGYMQYITESHLHDLGKYLFGFSIMWAYLWFVQFLFIWYANIQEETVYFVQRLEHFPILFYANVIINLVLPFFVLMSRGSKMKTSILATIAAIILIGHWIDLYLVIMPGSVGNSASVGFLEIGLSIGYAGLFLYVIFNSLTKASLVPVNHPFLEESLHYET
ncbi:MAG: quinol:cytochrome C oxidoreductase [Chlorobi bacterium]|nr:quinol:cytochrome C oxidoreductase [Chlorobiota bacterium]